MLIEPAILCPCPYRRSIPTHFSKLHITAPNTHHLQPIIGQFLREIAKSNIVGYQTYVAHTGYNLYSPTFIGLGADQKLSIQDIKIPNADGWGCESIWVINEDGTSVTGDTYTYKSLAAGEDVEGWWDDTNDKLAELEISEGQGFYIYCDGADKEFQVSGQVKIGRFSTVLHANYNYSGNFSPVDISIQKMSLADAQGWGCESIWEMNDDGTSVTGNTYTWKTEAAGEDVTGWWDDTNDKLADITLKAGEGIFIYCDGDGVSLEIDEVLSQK